MSFRFPARWHGLESAPTPLSEALARRRAAGLPLLDLTGSNPTTAGTPLPEDWTSLLADPAGRTYAPESKGLRVTRAAIARYYAERDGAGSAIDPEALFLTAGTSEGYAHLFRLLCEPGDEALVPRPSYPLFDTLASLSDVELRPYPLLPAADAPGMPVWRIDFAALESAVTPRTRAILVVSPNNPTGNVLSGDEATALLAFAARHGLAVIVDEVFADYIFGSAAASHPQSARPARRLASHDVPVFTLNGLSKLVGLPQLKLAWIHVDGNPADKAVAMNALEWMCDAHLSVSTAAQLAAPELLRRRAEFQAPIRARLAENLKTLEELATTHASLQPLLPEGGWAAPIRCLGLKNDEDDEALTIRLVEEHGVLAQPGYFYDFEEDEGEATLVVSLLTPPEVFREGLTRIAAALG
jgi:alanine-synthesizing transaminase